jgi:hypothetical protein
MMLIRSLQPYHITAALDADRDDGRDVFAAVSST